MWKSIVKQQSVSQRKSLENTSENSGTTSIDGTKVEISNNYGTIPDKIDEAAELNYMDCSPVPPLSAPAGAIRGRLSIERTYDMLVKKLNQAKENGDDFEESVILKKKAIIEEEMKRSVLVDRMKGRPINIPLESAGAQRIRIDMNPVSVMNSRMSVTDNFVFLD